MAEQDYFKNALSNFVHDVASGGTICHLADLGYTVRKITDKLDFPTPYAKVQQTVWKHYVETSVILLEEPGTGKKKEQYRFVKEQNQYGTTSFRRVKVSEDEGKKINWKTKRFQAENSDEVIDYLKEKISKNGKSDAYMSCDFGKIQYKDVEQYDKIRKVLEPKQREYLEGLPWEISRCYHKLDERMMEILLSLCRQKMYYGMVYFWKLEERVEIVK